MATPEVAILLDADTINNNNAQMMRLLLERIRALSPGLVWRWLGGAGRLDQGGEGGVAARSCPSTFAVGHRSLSLPTTHPTIHISTSYEKFLNTFPICIFNFFLLFWVVIGLILPNIELRRLK